MTPKGVGRVEATRKLMRRKWKVDQFKKENRFIDFSTYYSLMTTLSPLRLTPGFFLFFIANQEGVGR